jgi:DNA (cytosine-5)-methyltransferase 1
LERESKRVRKRENKLKYLSVCSGIEAATVAWHKLGWEAVGFSEIEPFPSAVLNHHFPKIKNYGDMTRYKEWNIERGSVDILVGGTPCQSYSIAGLRKGLKDPRGNLMLTYGAIADHLRPRIIVWENVPGVLSSFSGEEPPSDLQEGEEWETTETSDFGGFLSMLAELGYGFAYRVLDAQYVRVESHERAVPQRRRRVFVVGYLGDWRRAAAILFESESMSRYTPPSRKTGKGFTANVAPSLTASGRGVKNTGETRGQDPVIPVLMDQGGSVMNIENNISGTLRRETKGHEPIIIQPYQVGNCLIQRMHKGINTTLDEGQTPVIAPIPIHDKATRHEGKSGKGSGNGIGIGNPGDPSPTLTTGDHHAVGYHTTGAGFWKESKESGTLRAREQDSHENVVAGFLPRNGKDAGSIGYEEGVSPTIRAGCDSYGVQSGYRVRRLTPNECARLQGFPDNWARIPWRGKPAELCPDGPQYKAYGNSMATNVMYWLGERIDLIEKEF